MKKLSALFLGASLLLTCLLTGCMEPGNFTLSIRNYDPFTDTAWVTVSNDKSDCQVRKASCYWTFDGTEPNDMQTTNTNVEDFGGSDKEFDIKIPSDFYSGKINFLCKITYSMMGKKETVTKRFSKSYKVEYHDAPSNELTLKKNEGYAKRYYVPTSDISVSDNKFYTTEEDGTVIFTCLLGETKLEIIPIVEENMIPTEDGNKLIYEDVPANTKFKVHYQNGTWGTSTVADAEYTIILK